MPEGALSGEGESATIAKWLFQLNREQMSSGTPITALEGYIAAGNE
jgi:hypothetical protein